MRAALAALEASRQRIDDLNVYPVPDGDTGTNMTMTVRAVVDALERDPEADIGRAILSRTDVARLEELAVGAGLVTRWDRACRAVEDGLTSPAEVRRVLGFFDGPGADGPE